jgi:hypothetical protein
MHTQHHIAAAHNQLRELERLFAVLQSQTPKITDKPESPPTQTERETELQIRDATEVLIYYQMRLFRKIQTRLHPPEPNQ